MQCLFGQSRSFTRVTRRAIHDYLEVIASVEYCVWTDDPEQPIFKVYCIGFDSSETIRTTIHNTLLLEYSPLINTFKKNLPIGTYIYVI